MVSSPAVPYSRDYKKKYEYFRGKIKKFAITQPGTRFDIKVRTSLGIDNRSLKLKPKNKYQKTLTQKVRPKKLDPKI